jgi:hypothetical protein
VDLREQGQAGRRHPWETARARFFRSLIARHTAPGGPGRVLDVGAGDGWFAGELGREAAGAAIVCWDVTYRSADLAADLAVVASTGCRTAWPARRRYPAAEIGCGRRVRVAMALERHELHRESPGGPHQQPGRAGWSRIMLLTCTLALGVRPVGR